MCTHKQQHICTWYILKTFFFSSFSYTQVHCNQKIIKNNSIKNLYSTHHISSVLYSQPVFPAKCVWWYNTKLKFSIFFLLQKGKNKKQKKWEFNFFSVVEFCQVNWARHTGDLPFKVYPFSQHVIALFPFRKKVRNFISFRFSFVYSSVCSICRLSTTRRELFGWECRMPNVCAGISAAEERNDNYKLVVNTKRC